MRSTLSLLITLVASMPALAGAQITMDTQAAPGPVEIVAAPEAASSAPIVADPPARSDSGEDIHGYSGFGAWVEEMDLRGVGLRLGRPEVEALRGVTLGAGWAGNAPLANAGVGGASINVGMRGYEYLRGPEVRLMLGGGDLGGVSAPAPGVEELELTIESVFLVRIEAAIGVQVPLGPVVPYVMARAAVGGAFFDISVREARLGRIGIETADATVLELGLEAGVGFRVAPGLELGVAFRGSFLGTESLGGMVTLGFDGSTIE